MRLIRVAFVLSALFVPSALSAQVIGLKGKWKFRLGDDAGWSARNLDDSDWEQISVPGAWEDRGFNGYDGFAWYRISFDGRKLNKEEIYYANLGFIDDADEVYLNGMLIGFSGQCPPKFKTAYNSERKYVMPAQVLNLQGQNTIAIRVFDAMHSGGIVDGDIGIFSLNEGARLIVDLQGVWSFALSSRGDRPTQNTAWEKIMVPGPWELQGHRRYDGFAWYKRTFTLPANAPEEQLVLMLGKVDDFDKVYLNGRLIGATNDHQPYGASSSYEKNRVYFIPPEILRRAGPNTIEVLVEDMGNVGGIYEGIVGIATRTNYERHFREEHR